MNLMSRMNPIVRHVLLVMIFGLVMVLVYPLTSVIGTPGAALAIVISAAAPIPWMLKLYARANEARAK